MRKFFTLLTEIAEITSYPNTIPNITYHELIDGQTGLNSLKVKNKYDGSETSGSFSFTTRAKNESEKRKGLNTGDTRQITRALENNWVITFPQGTTKPFAPGRKGTALIIKQTKPVVIPVVISGFWRAFDKKGLRFKKKGTLLSVKFKEPLNIDYDASTDVILAQLMDAIEQSKEWMMKGAHHWKTVPSAQTSSSSQ